MVKKTKGEIWGIVLGCLFIAGATMYGDAEFSRASLQHGLVAAGTALISFVIVGPLLFKLLRPILIRMFSQKKS